MKPINERQQKNEQENYDGIAEHRLDRDYRETDTAQKNLLNDFYLVNTRKDVGTTTKTRILMMETLLKKYC